MSESNRQSRRRSLSFPVAKHPATEKPFSPDRSDIADPFYLLIQRDEMTGKETEIRFYYSQRYTYFSSAMRFAIEDAHYCLMGCACPYVSLPSASRRHSKMLMLLGGRDNG